MKNKLAELMAIALVLLSSVLLFFVRLDSIGITDPGEAYYAEAGREMIESGDYIVPHLNYQIYFSKPILTFWIMAFAYKVFGVSEFSARILFAVLILLLTVASYWVARRIRNWRCGLMAGLITATTPLLIAVAKLSPIDVAFTCFWDLAMFALIFTFCFEQYAWPVFYMALALATLTKGPAALVLAGLAVAVFVVTERPSMHVLIERWRRLHPFLGVLLFAAMCLPWYIAVGRATNGLFPKVFFLYENLARFQGYTNLAHTTWYHYLIVLLYGFFPWVLFLIPSVGPAWRKSQHLESLVSAQPASEAQHSALLFLISLSATVLLFFSLSHTQLDTYLLPAVAPMAVLIANYFESKLEESQSSLVVGSQISLRPLVWVSGIFLVIGCVALIGSVGAYIRIGEPDIKYGAMAAAVTMAVGYIAQYWFYRKQKYGAMFISLFVATVLATAIAGQIAFTLLDTKGQRDLRQLCQRIGNSDDQVAIFRTFKPSIMFYTKRPVDSFFHTSQLVHANKEAMPGKNLHGDGARLMVIVHDKTLPELQATPGTGLKLLTRCGNWSLWQTNQAQLEKVQTLEAIFRNKEAFERAVSGQSDWGPLTVPYAAGDPKWRR
jgi:4-amino-4-deoxy-L-arabinose transferase-like glycosyltransferase